MASYSWLLKGAGRQEEVICDPADDGCRQAKSDLDDGNFERRSRGRHEAMPSQLVLNSSPPQ